MRNLVGAIAASAFIACVLVLPQGFVSSAQSQGMPTTTAMPGPAAGNAFETSVCATQGWPYFDQDCKRGADTVRVIKIGATASGRR